MTKSPYDGKPDAKWKKITEELIKKHPVLGDRDLLLQHIKRAWHALWSTTVGTGELAIPLKELAPRAQIVGDFFENLLSKDLGSLGGWRRGSSKEKDVVQTKPEEGSDFDFEIKTSGQASGKIYGNRSYAQEGKDGTIDSPSRKKRSGYYLCVNFTGHTIYRVRVGWIDAEDWSPQKSGTGQAASLKDYVYDYKLVDVFGAYLGDAPLYAVLDGIGAKTLGSCEVKTLGNVIEVVAGKVAPGAPRSAVPIRGQHPGKTRRGEG
jgi:hypothetical protein